MIEIFSKEEINQFILSGYVRLDDVFSRETADSALDILWQDLPCERSDPSTWVKPLIRLGMYSQQPFLDSINSTKMHAAFDQLVGRGKWLPSRSVGTFPVRFPATQQPADTGKHVDASFPGNDPHNFLEWRINVQSRGRALLLLILYADVGEKDAPTVIYKGSHQDVARLLAEEDETGLSFMELAGWLEDLPKREEILATGKAGTVYLCHPFLVHSAQAHQGSNPRFMAQPPLLPKGDLCISDGAASYSPVEQAIRVGIGAGQK